MTAVMENQSGNSERITCANILPYFSFLFLHLYCGNSGKDHVVMFYCYYYLVYVLRRTSLNF